MDARHAGAEEAASVDGGDGGGRMGKGGAVHIVGHGEERVDQAKGRLCGGTYGQADGSHYKGGMHGHTFSAWLRPLRVDWKREN